MEKSKIDWGKIMSYKHPTREEKEKKFNEEHGIVRVHLNEAEMQRVEEITETRDRFEYDRGNVRVGAMGEVIVEKFLQGYFYDHNCFVDEGDQPDPGWDLCWKERLIDVKTHRRNKRASLNVTGNCLEKEACDYFVLVRIGAKFGDIEGWISREDYEAKAFEPFGNSFQLNASHLMPINYFLDDDLPRFRGRSDLRRQVHKSRRKNKSSNEDILSIGNSFYSEDLSA